MYVAHSLTRLHISFVIIRDRYFCTHESFILVQKVGSLNIGVGQLETLFVSPAVNVYLLSNQRKERRNELRVPYLVLTVKWPSNAQFFYCETPYPF